MEETNYDKAVNSFREKKLEELKSMTKENLLAEKQSLLEQAGDDDMTTKKGAQNFGQNIDANFHQWYYAQLQNRLSEIDEA